MKTIGTLRLVRFTQITLLTSVLLHAGLSAFGQDASARRVGGGNPRAAAEGGTITRPEGGAVPPGVNQVLTPPPATVPLTQEQLAAVVVALQARVAQLEAKTKFADMDIFTFVADEKSLTPTQQPGFYKPEIRIDHPLTNNNPDAVFFLQSGQHGSSHREGATFEYRKDGFWYVNLSRFYVSTIDYFRIHDRGVAGNGHQVPADVFAVDDFDKMLQVGGLAHAKINTPQSGERYTLLIFKTLPDEYIGRAASERVVIP